MFTLWQENKMRLLPLAPGFILGTALGTVLLSAPFTPAIANIAPPIPMVKPVLEATEIRTGALADIPVPANKPASVIKATVKAVRASDDTIRLNTIDVPLPRRKPVVKDNTASETQAVTHEVAMLREGAVIPVPKVKPIGQENAPLNQSDILLYKEIFAFQADAHWDKADELLGMLTDYRLRGHILYQRYMHPTAYTAAFDELSGWLNSYADHPGADRIYKLALARMPEGYRGYIEKPQSAQGITGYLSALNEYDRSYSSTRHHSASVNAHIRKLQKSIEAHISKGRPTAALKMLQTSEASGLMDAGEYDEMLASIANSYMMAGNLQKAQELSIAAAKRSGRNVPRAGWVAGLTSWRLDDFAAAGFYFAQAAESDYASTWMISASGFWASRAYMRSGKISESQKWLKVAASHPRTFYGLIATRALGWNFDFNWDMPAYRQSYAQALHKYEGARRAMLLTQAGQYHLAEAELRRIPVKDRKMTQALMAYAGHMGLPSYAMRLASAVRAPNGRLYDAGLYPLAPWKPKSGYKVDRALIHALIRQESKFNPSASNRYSGATGLMQLMPQTATYVSGRRDFRSRAGHHVLKDPQINLDIGQRYVQDLMYQSAVNAELFSLVIAYNAGPGNLRKWKRKFADMNKDPLLFVESIPMRETRAFVERVMANYWIYRMRLGQPTPSLDAVAEGRWARYVQLDTQRTASTDVEIPYMLAAN